MPNHNGMRPGQAAPARVSTRPKRGDNEPAGPLRASFRSRPQWHGPRAGPGLPEVVPDPLDRRAMVVAPTASGRANVAAALRIFGTLEDRLAAQIGGEQMAVLLGMRRAATGDPESAA